MAGVGRVDHQSKAIGNNVGGARTVCNRLCASDWSGSLTNLGSGAYTVGVGSGVCILTLGGDAGVVVCLPTLGSEVGVGGGAGVCMPILGSDAGIGLSWMFGGLRDGRLKIARRLFTAKS